MSELIAHATSPWLDLWCGATYLTFVVEVLGVTALLFSRARPKALELSLGFLVVNLIGWAIWFLYPAAPPWYVDRYGVGPAVLDAVSSPAGLARLDAMLHVPIATTFYSKSANVFGAVPSLHVAYATLVAHVVHPLGGRLRLAAWAFALSMAFSAVYLRHHYLIDVFAGVFLALIVGTVMRNAFAQRRPVRSVDHNLDQGVGRTVALRVDGAGQHAAALRAGNRDCGGGA